MEYAHVFFFSPPFYSHFMPLAALAKSFKKSGSRVTIGCSLEFKEAVLSAELEFYEINISTNRNTGTADNTEQPESEKMRLDAFFDATKVGAVETLMIQSKHRKEDMLSNPEELFEAIHRIEKTEKVDLWVVDVLSYGVTLCLHCLELPYITFCPPHPNTIPREDENFGVPTNWPSSIDVDPIKLEKLNDSSIQTQQQFTDIFNAFIFSHHRCPNRIDNAFRLHSEIAIIYNYFDFKSVETLSEKPRRIYIGHSFDGEMLSQSWLKKVDNEQQRKILITLGTFLSSRMDVLIQLIQACQAFEPEALIIVSAGSNAKNLKQYESSNVSICEFVPQKALLPFMDIVIHHGGCNTFTETVYYGKPMIILPFSSDQFNIAYDAESNDIAITLDPNRLTKTNIMNALNKALKLDKENLRYWSRFSRERGPDYAARILGDFGGHSCTYHTI
ncbi:MAG: glycosyltransferase family 1 protein [Tissierellales bacterium]|nr:glycosyltransferase family 1 protein [Tissierellales bacterium]